MESVAAVFTSRSDAEQGSARLLALGIPKDGINILTPHATENELAAVPIDDAEPLGIGKALGAAVGGAVGLAGGIGLGGVVTSLIVPGIGPVLAIGLAGAALPVSYTHLDVYKRQDEYCSHREGSRSVTFCEGVCHCVDQVAEVKRLNLPLVFLRSAFAQAITEQ